MKAKYLLTIVLALLLAFSLAACGNIPAPAEETVPPAEEAAPDPLKAVIRQGNLCWWVRSSRQSELKFLPLLSSDAEPESCLGRDPVGELSPCIYVQLPGEEGVLQYAIPQDYTGTMLIFDPSRGGDFWEELPCSEELHQAVVDFCSGHQESGLRTRTVTKTESVPEIDWSKATSVQCSVTSYSEITSFLRLIDDPEEIAGLAALFGTDYEIAEFDPTDIPSGSEIASFEFFREDNYLGGVSCYFPFPSTLSLDDGESSALVKCESRISDALWDIVTG